jgi:hypothetical protein
VIDRTRHDYRARRPFAGVHMMSLKESAALRLCDIAGGPCKYRGAPIAKVHAGMGLKRTRIRHHGRLSEPGTDCSWFGDKDKPRFRSGCVR